MGYLVIGGDVGGGVCGVMCDCGNCGDVRLYVERGMWSGVYVE
jgi:hypothetical protein